jgi:hypothetical protein
MDNRARKLPESVTGKDPNTQYKMFLSYMVFKNQGFSSSVQPSPGLTHVPTIANIFFQTIWHLDSKLFKMPFEDFPYYGFFMKSSQI